MTRLTTNLIQAKWVQRVRQSLRTRGYYYEPDFCDRTADEESLIEAAKLLGSLYVPRATEHGSPLIHTEPSRSAPRWRPFDRAIPIRWHNDFSTRAGRPELSFSLVRQQDPGGLMNGAWCVASSAAILAKLFQTGQGKRLVADLTERAEPFGYRDAGGWHPFRVIIRDDRRLGRIGLRFYGPALEDGAWLRFGRIPERTQEIVSRIEEAADAVREVLPAPTGSLLIVHNSLCLHDRSPQTVTGPKEGRRRAVLCFVKQLHNPL